MRVRVFKHGVGNGWEFNFIGKVYNLRIVRHQFAFWKNDMVVFQRLSKISQQH